MIPNSSMTMAKMKSLKACARKSRSVLLPGPLPVIPLDTIKEEEVDLFGDDSGGKGEPGPSPEQVKAEENASDFKKAVECIINTSRASTSHFQRKLGWGYNHSAKIMDMLEDAGVIGPQIGAGPRQIIMDQEQLLSVFNSGSGPEGNGQDPQEDDGQ